MYCQTRIIIQSIFLYVKNMYTKCKYVYEKYVVLYTKCIGLRITIVLFRQQSVLIQHNYFYSYNLA